MVSLDIIAWRSLREDYIVRSVPIEQVIMRSPELRLIYDPGAGRLGMRLRLDPGRNWSSTDTLRNVTMRLVLVSGVHYVEVSTNSKDLFRPIYLLMSDVLSRILEGERDCLRALELSLEDFESLVAKSGQISKEKAIGLFGELWVLHALLEEKSAGADSWIGASREPHDFRLGSLELEVKTTTSNVRKHSIHGLNQLSPTPGYDLELISIRIGSSGYSRGRTVNSIITDIRTILGAEGSSLRKFNKCLMAFGYDSEHAECLVPYQLAATPMAIAMGSDFPVVSYEWLSSALGSGPSSRIREVDLTLDLEGLGRPFDAAHYRIE
jgi:hypothetical protein